MSIPIEHIVQFCDTQDYLRSSVEDQGCCRHLGYQRQDRDHDARTTLSQPRGAYLPNHVPTRTRTRVCNELKPNANRFYHRPEQSRASVR
jgi:hypothetical protein